MRSPRWRTGPRWTVGGKPPDRFDVAWAGDEHGFPTRTRSWKLRTQGIVRATAPAPSPGPTGPRPRNYCNWTLRRADCQALGLAGGLSNIRRQTSWEKVAARIEKVPERSCY